MLRHVAYWVTAILLFPAMGVTVLALGWIPAVLAYAIIIPLAAWGYWWAVKEQRKDDAARALD